MAKRGRKEATPELKVLKGTRKERLQGPGSRSDGSRPVCPAHLTGEAAAAWEAMVGLLEERGTLDRTDAVALEIYAAVYARWRQALRELAASVSSTTAAGSEKSNPAARVAAAAEAQLLKLLAEFGCTPTTRAKRKSPGTDAVRDGLGEFLSKRRPG